jgi:hydrogenase maturation protease
VRKVVILGYGNPQRHDDGLARTALERLELACLPGEVEFVHAYQLVPEHASIASQADLLIFVDASQTGPSGEIRIERIRPGGAFPSPSHHLSAPALLTLMREAYGAEPEAYLATVRGESFELGEGLTPAMERLLPQLVRAVSQIVEERSAG